MNQSEGIALTVVAAGAVVLPGVARRLGVPVAVTEILFGVLIGRTGLGLAGAGEGEILRSLGELGFALFLFVAGMEIDVGALMRGATRAVLQPLASGVLTFVVAFAAAFIFGWNVWIALAIGATSVPLMTSVLRESGLSRAPVAQRMLLVAGVGELVTIAIVAVAEVATHAEGAVVTSVLRMFVPVAATILGAIVLRALVWWFPGPFVKLLAAEDPQELGMRAGVALMALFAGLAALGGIEPVLGAFVAGLLVAFVLRDRGQVEHKLAGAAYGFFVPVFFIGVGMRVELHPAALLEQAGFIVAMLVVLVLARAPAVAMLAGSGLRARDAAAAGLLLSAPLTLLIAVLDLGLRAGAISEEIEAAGIFVAILASVLYPAVARPLLRSGRRLQAAEGGHG